MIRKQLLSLIQAALWHKEPDTELFRSCDWNKVFELAKEQTVLGLALSGKTMLPKKLQPDMRTALNWVKRLVKIEERNETMDKAVIAITRQYKSMGLNPLVMKGQVIARLYPNPAYRQSGDIDICFKTEEEAMKAYQWAEESPECKTRTMVNEKEQPFSWKGITIENHERVADMSYNSFQVELQSIIREEFESSQRYYTEIRGEKIETFSPTLTVFHLLVHIEYHLLNEGVGLRQMCDLAVALNNLRDIDKDRLNTWIKLCGLSRIASAIGWVVHTELGVEESLIPWSIAEEGAAMIINDIWTGGNFGKKIWAFKGRDGFLKQKIKATPLHWMQYRKYRNLLPNEAWANFISKFGRAARGVK